MKGIEQIFRPVAEGERVIAPPEQVFANSEFTYLFTIGGHLTSNATEYRSLMGVLQQLGEEYIEVMENLGATQTERIEAMQARITTQASFEEFEQVIQCFDQPFGFFTNHFYVFGRNAGWGIYLCEYPTINIIGCLPEWQSLFAQVYGIEGNGFQELETFLDQEYQGSLELKRQLKKAYKVKNEA